MSRRIHPLFLLIATTTNIARIFFRDFRPPFCSDHTAKIREDRTRQDSRPQTAGRADQMVRACGVNHWQVRFLLNALPVRALPKTYRIKIISVAGYYRLRGQFFQVFFTRTSYCLTTSGHHYFGTARIVLPPGLNVKDKSPGHTEVSCIHQQRSTNSRQCGTGGFVEGLLATQRAINRHWGDLTDFRLTDDVGMLRLR